MLIIIAMFVIVMFNISSKDFTLLDYFSGDYTVYTSTNNTDAINLGFCFMSNNKVKENVIGESVKINNFEPVSALKVLNAKIIKTEQLENGTTVIYAFTDKISQNVIIDNKQVNLQIAHNDNYSIVGWPLILGSF